MAADLMKLITQLRDKTGMGVSACKKALQDNQMDLDAAEMQLRKQGLDKAAKKADRPTGQGVVAVRVNGLEAAMVYVSCEQEPTTGNTRFVELVEALLDTALRNRVKDAEALAGCVMASGQTVSDALRALIGVVGENVVLRKAVALEAPAGGLIGHYLHFNKKAGALMSLKLTGADAGDAKLRTAANDVCMHAVAARPLAARRDEIAKDVVDREVEVFREAVKDKPAAIQDKIVEGKLASFYKEKVLLEQDMVTDPEGKLTVRGVLTDAAKAAGGTMEVVAFERFELGA